MTARNKLLALDRLALAAKKWICTVLTNQWKIYKLSMTAPYVKIVN